MRLAALVSVLFLTTALAGCSDDEPIEAGQADSSLKEPYFGQTRPMGLGTFTWGDQNQGPGLDRIKSTVASLQLPTNATQVIVYVARDHSGVERAPARMILSGPGPLSATADFQVSRFGIPTPAQRLELAAVPGGAGWAEIEYEYDTQVSTAAHNLELRVLAYVPRGP